MDISGSRKIVPPSNYDAIEDIFQGSTMWYNTDEVPLFQEEKQKVDTKATCTYLQHVNIVTL